ncbi:MAG: hypothetical protein L3K16_03525 [Thermoplasmata archaeon]|nr:hypothetical protein [Thermoplasmata archaeon]
MAASPPTSVTCPVCGVVLSNEMELGEHKEVHAEQRAEGESTTAIHGCAFCPAKFRTPEELRDHHRVAHNR